MIAFSSFDTESGYDFVTINECSSASGYIHPAIKAWVWSYDTSCASPRQLARLSGSAVSARTVYTSSTGALQVVFEADGSGDTYAGYEAAWRVEPKRLSVDQYRIYPTAVVPWTQKDWFEIMMTECSECPAGTYTNVSGSSSCTKCPAGSFQHATGATGCDACKPHSGSPLQGRGKPSSNLPPDSRETCLCYSGYRPGQVEGNNVALLAAEGNIVGYCEKRLKQISKKDVTFVVVSIVFEILAVLTIAGSICDGLGGGISGCGGGGDCWFLLVLVDIGFSVGKLYPGPSYFCHSWSCRKVTHVCTMTLCSFPFQLFEVLVLMGQMKVEREESKVPASALGKLLHIGMFSANLAFVLIDAATQDPPGVGTKLLVVFASLSEALLIAIELLSFFCIWA